MTDHAAPPVDQKHRTASTGGSDWASGGTVFAGVLMMVTGILSVLNGIAGIAADDVYTRVGSYVYEFNLTTWGWIHLVIGVLVAITGWGILQGMDWARGVGIGLAALSMIEYFMFLPYAPFWSIISIAIAVFVIWALATAGRPSTTK
ncbi:hypothetical protein ACFVYG_15735 [Streptomyces sp. NPDC058256]|uniref:DUF7144 family membrane protein n=1 Tax=Streptomyces sp. NPDC058256 TaxID=3346408 RepID=UPI0036E36B8C